MEQKDEGYFAYYAKIDKVYRKLCALEVAEYCFRLIHLSLTDKSDDIVARLRKCRQEFAGKLYAGVPQEDMEAMARTTKVINENLDNILKGMK